MGEVTIATFLVIVMSVLAGGSAWQRLWWRLGPNGRNTALIKLQRRLRRGARRNKLHWW